MKNLHNIRDDFPIFRHHPDMAYLDSAATALKPKAVIDAVSEYYATLSTNVGRGLYPLAEETTTRMEQTREKTARFIGADTGEIIFTHGATESMNLLAFILSDRVKQGDSIVITAMEHHSNFLPWERLAREHGAELRVIPLAADGTVDMDMFRNHVGPETRILAFPAVSNVLGTINPVAAFVREAKRLSPDILTIVDAAQAAGHLPIDVKEWKCDFLAFSGHKMFGPTGIGILYGKHGLLETLPPYQVGGGMVEDACARDPEYKAVPYRFEAGTPDIAAIIGFGAAIDFIGEIGIGPLREHEIGITRYALDRLRTAFGADMTIYGPGKSEGRGGLISFTLDRVHPHDLAQVLGEKNIAIRAGEHCAAPLHRALDIPATARISFSAYTETGDIDRLIEGMKDAQRIFNA